MQSTESHPQDRHYPMLDAGRVAAAVAIVWMHVWGYSQTPQIGEVGRFAVPFFAASALFLMARGLMRNPNRPFAPYAIHRIYRIYFPFLAWSFIGLFAEDAHRELAHRPIVMPQAFHLYFGSTMQLWFLPFLLGLSLTLFLPLRLATRFRTAAAIFALAAGTICALLPRISLDAGAADTNWLGFVGLLQNSWNAAPCVFWGVAIAFLYDEKSSPALAWIGIAVLLAGLALLVHGPRNALLENLAGAGALLFCINVRQSPGRIASYAFLAYGIYLSHSVFLEAIHGAFHRSSDPAATSIIFLAILGLSIASCLFLHRWKQTRWMLG